MSVKDKMENVQQNSNGASFNDYNDVNLTIRILFHGRVCIFIFWIKIVPSLKYILNFHFNNLSTITVKNYTKYT